MRDALARRLYNFTAGLDTFITAAPAPARPQTVAVETQMVWNTANSRPDAKVNREQETLYT